MSDVSGVAWRGRLWRFAGAEDDPAAAPSEGQEPKPDGREPSESQPTPERKSGGQEPQTFDAEYVKALRAEAAANRKRAAEAEARLKAHEDEKLSEAERQTKRIAELEAENQRLAADRRERLIRAEIRVQASAEGFSDPDDAWRLLDPAAIEADEQGEPKNVGALLKALAKAKPYLLRKPAAEGVPATPKADGKLSDEERARQAVGIRQIW